ncbi:MAG: BatA domain-containing protein, partial [Planctomycetota bacterium]
MSFLSIAFLFALPLAAAPLLLHLFDRRRNAVIQWGAMQFLMEAAAKKTSARRLKQWLLLAMRVLAIAGLIFALARPLLPAGYLGGEFRGETILVLDNSMSMLRTGNDETLIKDAIKESLSRLDELPASDDVRILTSAPYPVWGDVGRVRSDRKSRQWLKDYLGELEATRGRSDLLAALFEAVQVEHAPNQSSRRIVVLTDGQAADWRLDDTTGWNRFHQLLDQTSVSTEIDVIRLDELSETPTKGNLSVDGLSISRGVVGVGQPVTVTARLNNRGVSSLAPGELVWFVDGQEFHRQVMDSIDGGQNLDVPWEFSFPETGTYQFSCQLQCEDDLIADNHSSLVVE